MKKLLVFLFAGLMSSLAQAQTDARWPAKAIRIVVPFSAGALTDVVARMYSVELSKRLGVPVIVENKPGAGGVIAAQGVASSPADGYTLMLVSSAHAVNPSLKKSLPFDTTRDLAGVALVASSPTLVIVNSGSSFKTLQELISAARAKPGALNYGSAGIGSATQLAGEYIFMESGTRMNHVPFKGVQEAVTEVLGGRIETAFPPIALALPMVKDGKLRALATTGNRRSDLLPSVPTVAELGFKDFDYRIWYAFVTRAGVPPAVMTRLAQEIRAVSDQSDLQQKMRTQGLDPTHIELADFDRYILSEIEKLGRIVKAAGIQPD
jgi:tripartite-type tricarboxylate transporter receptor subunit TctC